MAEITATLVKTLREKTGCGMMDCKKALIETSGDLENAIDWLRKKGLSVANKKAGRVAAEGLVAVFERGTRGCVLEVNAETDFVARNKDFQAFVRKATERFCDTNLSPQELLKDNNQELETELTQLIAVIGENMTMRRGQRVQVEQGVVSTYVHNVTAAGLGRIGVLVALESPAKDIEKLKELGKKIAMHIAAASPIALSIQDVSPAVLERETSVLTEQAKASGRPLEVISKMVEGRIRKFYEEVVLLEQIFMIDGKTKVSDVIGQASKELGAPITLKAFEKYVLGDGIEKESTDFAAEVQAMSGQGA